MKYLRQENNSFIFEDGELEFYPMFEMYQYNDVFITSELRVGTNLGNLVNHEDIQTAVQMMTILKDKRLV